MTTVPALLVFYSFNSSKDGDAAKWAELQKKLLASGARPMHMPVSAQKGREFVETLRLSAGTIRVETEHLFADQWNTAPAEGVTDVGLRVHRWQMFDYFNKGGIKEGYYVEPSAELLALMGSTNACGYCGKQEPAAKSNVFCSHCLDSVYLKETDLYLTRMRPVSSERSRNNRSPLTAAESAHLVPLYVAARINGNGPRSKRAAADRKLRIQRERLGTIADANEKADAGLWILDNFGNTLHENCIFYAHAGKHTFGWRKKLSAAEVSFVLDKISEFPFQYEILCDDGRTLEGNYRKA